MLLLYISHALPTQSDVPFLIHHHISARIDGSTANGASSAMNHTLCNEPSLSDVPLLGIQCTPAEADPDAVSGRFEPSMMEEMQNVSLDEGVWSQCL
jgi:hypothetical protein